MYVYKNKINHYAKNECSDIIKPRNFGKSVFEYCKRGRDKMCTAQSQEPICYIDKKYGILELREIIIEDDD